ncbi:MAG: hypothetical protein JWL86_2162 [Rhizobium sp.]|nr:hypothetical protein [Rhizobium sp.]
MNIGGVKVNASALHIISRCKSARYEFPLATPVLNLGLHGILDEIGQGLAFVQHAFSGFAQFGIDTQRGK